MEKIFTLTKEECVRVINLITDEIAEINDYLNSEYPGPNVKRIWTEQREALKLIVKKLKNNEEVTT